VERKNAVKAGYRAWGKTGMDYFTAVTELAKNYRQQLTNGNFAETTSFNPATLPPNMARYWANIMSPLAPGRTNLSAVSHFVL